MKRTILKESSQRVLETAVDRGAGVVGVNSFLLQVTEDCDSWGSLCFVYKATLIMT